MADESVKQALLKQLSRVEEHYSLQELSPLHAGGTADYYTEAKSAVEVAAAVKAAIDVQIPYLVIGSASRILFSEGGYPGIIIHNKTSSYGSVLDKSQVVVDAGMPLTQFITSIVGLGLGGLTPFYGEKGTVGGALYAGLTKGRFSFLSSLRYLTAVVPPTRLDKEATINRYKREWLEREPGLTRLRFMKEQHPDLPQPVILTAMFQLTSVRQDELRIRLQDESREITYYQRPGIVFGPIFTDSYQIPLEEMLKEIRAAKLRVGNIFPDAKFPMYLRSKGSARSSEIRALIEQIQDALEQRYGIRPASRYAYLGAL